LKYKKIDHIKNLNILIKPGKYWQSQLKMNVNYPFLARERLPSCLFHQKWHWEDFIQNTTQNSWINKPTISNEWI